MRLHTLRACTAVLLIASVPSFGLAQNAPPAPSAQAARVWATDGNTKRELALAQVQVARTDQSGANHGASSSVLANIGARALAVAGGPIGAAASSVFHMFGHHPAKPSFRAVLALAGQHSASVLSTNSPSFEIDYANTPGLDPDSYAPEILKLGATKDNRRLVAVSSTSDP